ncbi:hypothetical protein L195_g013779 [Trifolium pratense]|uniref:Uncharacterized protein n=1 Tax=Trifolium pratense TaxID=57577 RepID=A0A2K3PP34_TRIPR|nr:hypothetical protein L195_g013779 [Trifolium pratense]
MATVQLESFSLIRSSKLPPSIISSSLSSRPITARLPHNTGLKLRSLAATRLRSKSSSRVFPRRGSVVCEARDTAVEVSVPVDQRDLFPPLVARKCEVPQGLGSWDWVPIMEPQRVYIAL